MVKSSPKKSFSSWAPFNRPDFPGATGLMTRPPIPTNPFSTRFTRPGSIAFIDNADLMESASRRFRSHQFLGQIVGPHGCGKTTLSLAIQAQLQSCFRSARHVTWRRSKRWLCQTELPRVTDHPSRRGNQHARIGADADSESILLVVDGVESVSLFQRYALIAACRNHGNGLLLTTHRPLPGIPTIATLQPSCDQFLRIVEQLAPHFRLDPNELKLAFHHNGGNIREALMDLYDRFEADALKTPSS